MGSSRWAVGLWTMITRGGQLAGPHREFLPNAAAQGQGQVFASHPCPAARGLRGSCLETESDRAEAAPPGMGSGGARVPHCSVAHATHRSSHLSWHHRKRVNSARPPSPTPRLGSRHGPHGPDRPVCGGVLGPPCLSQVCIFADADRTAQSHLEMHRHAVAPLLLLPASYSGQATIPDAVLSRKPGC